MKIMTSILASSLQRNSSGSGKTSLRNAQTCRAKPRRPIFSGTPFRPQRRSNSAQLTNTNPLSYVCVFASSNFLPGSMRETTLSPLFKRMRTSRITCLTFFGGWKPRTASLKPTKSMSVGRPRISPRSAMTGDEPFVEERESVKFQSTKLVATCTNKRLVHHSDIYIYIP